MKVIQTNGEQEEFNPNKILYKIKSLSKGLDLDADSISQLIISRIIDGITTEQINKLSADLANTKITTSYDYSILAARLTLDNLYKTTPKSFVDSSEKLHSVGLLSEEYCKKVLDWGNYLDGHIVHDRDFQFDYLGVNSLLKSYLKKFDDKILETPQCMYMRLAVFLSSTKEEAAELYDQFSKHEISPASPIIFNAGMKESTLISCNLVTALESKGYNDEIKDPDSLEGLHELYRQACKLSAGAAGLGIDATDIRSKKSIINSSGGNAGGLLKMVLKPLNELMRGYNQKGSRPGAAAIYLEPWHMDIKDMLLMKRPNTSVEQACRDLFSAIWMNDLFMERLEERIKTKSSQWTLFDPKSLKDNGYDLHNVFGEEFKFQYEKAEQDENVLKEVVDVKEIWDLITASQMESGIPYMLYKDICNTSNMQSNIGVLKQSNLCSEILEVTDKNTVANCVLSAIPVGNPVYIKNGDIDWELLRKSTHQIVKYLNKICDINEYPTPQALKGGMDQRALGIGLMGLADLFAHLDLAFDSDEALLLSNRISEHMYYYALEASNKLAKEEGLVYRRFDGSPYQEGILHFDKYKGDVELDSNLDWKGLKESIKLYGLANSLLIAQMPTASSANLLSLNEACEPFVDIIYKRTLGSGEFIVVNKHLMKELNDLGLWCNELKNEVILQESVQNIQLERFSSSKTSRIAEEKGFDYITERIRKIKAKYKTAWELGAKPLINQAIGRQPFVDQTQSMNIFMTNPSTSKLTSMYLYGWKKGLKTGSYYIRTPKKNNNKTNAGVQVKQEVNKNPDIACIGCTV